MGSMNNILMQDKPIFLQPQEKDENMWFVMTSPDPKYVEERLLEENVRRESTGKIPFQYFVPYQFLKRRIADRNPEDELADGKYFNPKNRASVSSNNELRSALKRYIFIKASALDLESLLHDRESRDLYRTLWYYRDRCRKKVTVRHRMMEQFINACCDKRLEFEVWPAIEGIEENDEVVLNTTQFKGYKARVLEIRKGKNGCQLTVGFHLFHGAMLLKLPNLRPQDVLYESKESDSIVRETNRYKFLEDMQRKLFGIMSRRIKGGLSERIIRKDASALELLYNYRYRFFESETMRRKFYALMLLCALLRGDAFGKSELTDKVRRELNALERRSDGKISPDMRAYLQSVLYLSTREGLYYDEAMSYFRTHAKPSATHKQLMRFLTAYSG